MRRMTTNLFCQDRHDIGDSGSGIRYCDRMGWSTRLLYYRTTRTSGSGLEREIWVTVLGGGRTRASRMGGVEWVGSVCGCT